MISARTPGHTGLPILPRPSTGAGSGSARRAYSLVELLIVVVIMAILAVIAIPSFGSALEEQHVWAAAERLRADLQWARQHAISTSTPQAVVFGAHRYELPDMPALDDPSNPYEVNLLDPMYQATIASASLGGDDEVVFDIYGNADTDAKIELASGAFTKVIWVLGITGAVSVE